MNRTEPFQHIKYSIQEFKAMYFPMYNLSYTYRKLTCNVHCTGYWMIFSHLKKDFYLKTSFILTTVFFKSCMEHYPRVVKGEGVSQSYSPSKNYVLNPLICQTHSKQKKCWRCKSHSLRLQILVFQWKSKQISDPIAPLDDPLMLFSVNKI